MVTAIIGIMIVAILQQNDFCQPLSRAEQPTDSQLAERPTDSQPPEQPPNSREVSWNNVENTFPQHTAQPLTLRSLPISKDVIVHSVYFDDRARNGHANVSVFLVGANRTIYDNEWIIGCGVGDKDAEEFKVHFTAEDYLMHPFFDSEHPFPYEEFIVECYDLPVFNGSPAYVMYTTAHNSPVYVVESEKPLFVPAPRITPSGEHNISVVTCTKAHDKGVTWLPEFIRYQKTIGVDHVHVNILDTFIKDGGLKAHLMDSNLAQAVKEGFVSFSVWTDWYNPNEIYLWSEALRKLDCIYQYRGTYDYAFSLDTDDFFNPQIPGKTNVKDYILKWCYGNSIGSCSFAWVFYYPGACGIKDEPIVDGNVTRVLRSYASDIVWRQRSKSVHKTSVLLDTSFHDATCRLAKHTCLMPGFTVKEVPLHVAYMAHLRMHAMPSHSKC